MASCKKNKPPKGDYYCSLSHKVELDNGDSMLISRQIFVQITSSRKNEITFLSGTHTSVLVKSNNHISGSFRTNPIPNGLFGTVRYDPISIDGIWVKENGEYRIYGTFDALFYYAYVEDGTQYSDEYPVSGTFEIIPKE